MAKPSEWARRFEEWTTSLPADVQQTFDMLTNDSVAPPGRRWLAAALSYTLTQLDLIPDHERAGSIDDASPRSTRGFGDLQERRPRGYETR